MIILRNLMPTLEYFIWRLRCFGRLSLSCRTPCWCAPSFDWLRTSSNFLLLAWKCIRSLALAFRYRLSLPFRVQAKALANLVAFFCHWLQCSPPILWEDCWNDRLNKWSRTCIVGQFARKKINGQIKNFSVCITCIKRWLVLKRIIVKEWFFRLSVLCQAFNRSFQIASYLNNLKDTSQIPSKRRLWVLANWNRCLFLMYLG